MPVQNHKQVGTLDSGQCHCPQGHTAAGRPFPRHAHSKPVCWDTGRRPCGTGSLMGMPLQPTKAQIYRGPCPMHPTKAQVRHGPHPRHRICRGRLPPAQKPAEMQVHARPHPGTAWESSASPAQPLHTHHLPAPSRAGNPHAQAQQTDTVPTEWNLMVSRRLPVQGLRGLWQGPG